MNENLQNAVGTLIEKALSSVDSAGQFIQAELPDYIMQLMQWHFYYSLFFFIVGCILTFCCIYIPYHIWKNNEDRKEGRWDEEYIPLILIPIIPTFLFSCMIFFNIDWLQIWVAPKVWLVDYAASLVK